MILSLSVTDAELDRLLAGAQEQFPALKQVERIRLESALGVRVHLSTPAGKVEALVKLEARPGG